MVRIEQIKTLEAKVDKAIELIQQLRGEKGELSEQAAHAQKKTAELEQALEEYKADQGEMEKGILRVLRSLDQLEDEISGGDTDAENADAQAPDTPQPPDEKEELDIF